MRREHLRTLGINCAHDASACILVDGKVAAAIPEERLSRRKHSDGYPHLAIKYCLDALDLRDLRDVNCIVVNEYPYTDYTGAIIAKAYDGLLIRNPSHHLLHAYYAWTASGFNDTAILIVDGSGYSYGEYKRQNSMLLGPEPPFSEMEEAETSYMVKDGEICLVEKRWGLWQSSQPFFRFPSLGHMFSMASQYIFGHWIHAGKTMGLAPYGDAAFIAEDIVKCEPHGIEIDTEWITRLPPRSNEPAHLDKICCDVAAKVQQELEKAMLFLSQRLYFQTQVHNLAVSGGVALNCITNAKIMHQGTFSNVFVTPAANDSGIAIGAALYGYYSISKHAPLAAISNDFLGREYGDLDMEIALRSKPLIKWEIVEDPAEMAAQDIADGKIVGWYEGASEFGPRALGHRSILCDPRSPGARDKLNSNVKFREPFRPYAASVIVERQHEFFDLRGDSPHMLFAVDVNPSIRHLIPAVCHVDGTCRIQTVRPEYQGSLYRLITRFSQITGIPLVLNTSLNIRGEPIVESPQDALACFLGSGINILYLNKYKLTKPNIEGQNLRSLTPVLNDDLTLTRSSSSKNSAWEPEVFTIGNRTGYKAQIDYCQFDILGLVDGVRTVQDILDHLQNARVSECNSRMSVLLEMHRRGFIYFGDVRPNEHL